MSSNVLQTPLFISIALMLGFAIVLLVVLLTMRRIMIFSSARSKVRKFERSLASYRKRYEMLKTHALDYSNYLNTRKDNPLVELNSAIADLEGRIATVLELADNKDRSCLEVADQLLIDKFVPPILKARGSKKLIPWDKYLDELIQAVGEAIYEASHHARDIGLSGRGKKDTLLSLRDAGIDIEKIRKMFQEEQNAEL